MIDGTPIEEIIQIVDGCYRRIGVPQEKLERFTCYCMFEGEWTEEIDVDATDKTDAKIIGELAILWHYDEGLKLKRVKHIPRGMLYV